MRERLITAKRVLFSPAVLIGMCIFLRFNSAVAASSDEVVYVVNRHDSYLGKTIAYLGTTGAKVVCPEYKIVMVAKAPSWKVVEYNEVNKAAFEVPWDTWAKHGFRRAGSLLFMSDGAVRKSFDKGLKVNVVTVKHVANDATGVRVQGLYRSGVNKEVTIKFKELGYTDDVPISQKSREFIHGFIRAPLEARLPLSYTWLDETGRRLPVFTTDSIEKKMMNPSIFDYPKGYKATTQEDDVLMGGVRQREVEGVLDDLLGDDKDTTHGAPQSPMQSKKN